MGNPMTISSITPRSASTRASAKEIKATTAKIKASTIVKTAAAAAVAQTANEDQTVRAQSAIQLCQVKDFWQNIF